MSATNNYRVKERHKIIKFGAFQALFLALNLLVIGLYGFVLAGLTDGDFLFRASWLLLYLVLQTAAIRCLGKGFLVMAPIAVMMLVIGATVYNGLHGSNGTGLLLIIVTPFLVLYTAAISTLILIYRQMLRIFDWGPSREPW